MSPTQFPGTGPGDAQHIPPWAVPRGGVFNDPNPRYQLRANANLSYLEFIRVLRKMWEDGQGLREDSDVPMVPLRASGSPMWDPSYPCIIYSLELRKPMTEEPKPRRREIIETDGDEDLVIKGQRFQNIVLFTAIDEATPAGARNVEQIIEEFEDFMLEYTYVFKELGASELVYARRLPDDREGRFGQAVVTRTISYMLTTEKIITFNQWKLQSVCADIRLYLEDNQATPVDAQPLASQRTAATYHGYATAGTLQTLTDNRKAWEVDQWAGWELFILSGTGFKAHEPHYFITCEGLTRLAPDSVYPILLNDAHTLTIGTNFLYGIPDVTTEYTIGRVKVGITDQESTLV